MSEEKKVTDEEIRADEGQECEASEAQEQKDEEQETVETADTESNKEEETDTQEEAPAEETEKKSLFGKKKDKKDKKDQKIEELTDRLQRSMAEFDNFRKRTEKEKASMYIIGAKEVVEKILPVVDNFERGLATMEIEGDAFAEGMQMVYKQLMTVLEDMGVKPIEAVGQVFDPNLHNAVMHVEDDSVGENTVVEELQRGYLYKDFVVRHSMVKVAN